MNLSADEYCEAWARLAQIFGEQERLEDLSLMDSVIWSINADKENKKEISSEYRQNSVGN
jgi:hypothetical protein